MYRFARFTCSKMISRSGLSVQFMHTDSCIKAHLYQSYLSKLRWWVNEWWVRSIGWFRFFIAVVFFLHRFSRCYCCGSFSEPLFELQFDFSFTAFDLFSMKNSVSKYTCSQNVDRVNPCVNWSRTMHTKYHDFIYHGKVEHIWYTFFLF